MSGKCPKRCWWKTWKILVNFGQILSKTPCLVRKCIKRIQTNPKNQYLNDNKSVLKTLLVFTPVTIKNRK